MVISYNFNLPGSSLLLFYKKKSSIRILCAKKLSQFWLYHRMNEYYVFYLSLHILAKINNTKGILLVLFPTFIIMFHIVEWSLIRLTNNGIKISAFTPCTLKQEEREVMVQHSSVRFAEIYDVERGLFMSLILMGVCLTFWHGISHYITIWDEK